MIGVFLCAHDLRRQVRRVGLDEQRLERGAARGVAQIVGARIGHVARKRDLIAALQALAQAPGHREAVHDHAQPLRFRGELG